VRAEDAYQALRHDAEYRRAKQIRGNAEIEQARDRRRGVVGMQGRQHEMAGEGGLDRHLGSFQVTDFTNHDDVRVLPHERAHTLRETEVDHVLHLHLVERWFDHLDRILDGAHIDRRGGELLPAGVASCFSVE